MQRWPQIGSWQGWRLLAIAGLMVIGLTLPAWGSARLESRVNQLEFDLRRVRAELSQLEAQMGRANPQAAPIAAIATSPPSPDMQFDNLAVLAVETKRDLQRLEQRVDALETVVIP